MHDFSSHRFGRQLDVIRLMIDGRAHTSEELSKVLGTTSRNLRYFFGVLRECGFNIVRQGHRYYLGADSDFFRYVASNVNFSDDEAAYLFKLVKSVAERNKYTEAITNKPSRNYDISFVTDETLQNRQVQNMSRIYDAMDRRRVVILHNYSSPHSRTISDRYVEPFLFLNGQTDIRCYELASHKNKTFKLARVEEVRIVEDLMWSHEYMHKEVFMDIFAFSGEERHHVTLRLGQLARNILCEEYPRAERCLKKDGEKWIFETDVASYIGIGRFVLGLIEDIEILGDDGLRDYLRRKADIMQTILSAPLPNATPESRECAGDNRQG